MTRHATVALLAVLLALAGCGGPADPGPTASPGVTTAATASPTPSPTSTATPTASPASTRTATATAGPLSGHDPPPGVSPRGIRDVDALLSAHTAALRETGFASDSAGEATVVRNGVLLNVDGVGATRVTAGMAQYRYRNATTVGPFRRETRAWGNETLELRRTNDLGKVGYSRHEPRPAETLTGRWLLASHLRAGNYTVAGVEQGPDGPVVVLRATAVDDVESARRALPPEATNVTGFDATARVDLRGRVRALEVAMGYVIRGRNATLSLSYELARVGNVTVVRPDWAERGTQSDTPSPGSTSRSRPQSAAR